MSKIRIIGGKPLSGEVKISGAKNSALPIIVASMLTDESVTIRNIPLVEDVKTISLLLTSLGAKVKKCGKNIFINTASLNNTTAHIDIVSKMRASFLVFGPLLARLGKAKVGLPGGCSIGTRLVNYHLDGLSKMGAQINIKNKYVNAYTTGKLKGSEIFLETPSVGATENILMAATLARGTTIINNAAIEPEVVDLAHFLVSMGAIIEGIGTRKLIIYGVKKLHGCEYKIIPDRIEAATYAIAAAITGGDIILNNIDLLHLFNFIGTLKTIGIRIEILSKNSVKVIGSLNNIKSTNIVTNVYPDIATDLQSLFISLLSIANGKSTVKETIFNNRFGHVTELNSMGADISIKGNIAYIAGIKNLKGAKVRVTDLRAGAALILAGLSANGETIIEEVHHIERGYDNIEGKLSLCGANIQRIDSINE